MDVGIAAAAEPGQGAGDSTTVGEVIVTAERRAESLQRTPIAISAFTAKDLVRSQIDTPRDLQGYTPGLTVVDYGVPQIFIRGIGSNTFGAAVDPSAAMHIDNVYAARTYPAFMDFIDVDRVEVLRGPQGTLYGRNSTAGAINIISMAPTETFTDAGSLLYGSYNRLRARGTVSGPIAGPDLLGRLSISYNRRDGIYDNVIDGRKLDNQNSLSLRGALEWKASSNFDLTLRADYARQNQTGGVTKVLSSDPMLLAAGAIFPTDDFSVAYDQTPRFNVQNYGVALDAKWRLGLATLRSITAYRGFKSDTMFDTDGTNLPIAVGHSNENSKTFSQEFNLQSPTGRRFVWTAGLYYLHDQDTNEGGTFINPTGSVLFNPALIPPEGVISNFDPRTFLAGFPGGGSGTHANTTKAYAAFVDGGYYLAPTLKLGLGARYSRETKDTTVDLGFGASSAKGSWSGFTPRVLLEYTPTARLMIYGSYSKGFKSGGFNPFSTDAFKPEYVGNAEIGAKGVWLDGKLQTNLAVFDARYTDFQVQVLGPNFTTVVENAGRASSRGVELEFIGVPTEGLRINGSMAYLDTRYDDFAVTELAGYLPVSFPPYGVYNFPLLQQYDQSGTQMYDAPKWTVSLGGEYTRHLNDQLDVTVRAEYLWTDTVRTTRTFTRPAYDLVNLRLGLGPADGRWSVSAFGKNVTGTHYLSWGSVQQPLWGRLTSTIQGEPATWGLEFSFKH